MEDWAEIRRLHRAEGMPIKAIARRLRIPANTVKSAAAKATPPRQQRTAKGAAVDESEPRIGALLAEFPEVPERGIAERMGWTRSIMPLGELATQLLPPLRLIRRLDCARGVGVARSGVPTGTRLPLLVHHCIADDTQYAQSPGHVRRSLSIGASEAQTAIKHHVQWRGA